MKKCTFEFVTCVGVCEHSDRDWVIDRYGDNEEEFFLNFLRKNDIEYEVVEPASPSGDWPVIEYTVRDEEAMYALFEQFCASGYSAEEIEEKLEDWEFGDQSDPLFEEVMY